LRLGDLRFGEALDFDLRFPLDLLLRFGEAFDFDLRFPLDLLLRFGEAFDFDLRFPLLLRLGEAFDLLLRLLFDLLLAFDFDFRLGLFDLRFDLLLRFGDLLFVFRLGDFGDFRFLLDLDFDLRFGDFGLFLFRGLCVDSALYLLSICEINMFAFATSPFIASERVPFFAISSTFFLIFKDC